MMTSTSHAPSYAPRDNRMFAPLRLGPVTKARVVDESLAPPPQYLPLIQTAIPPPTAVDVKYPRIIVRDSMGRTLDTFTALQEAIYRASWTRKKWGEWPRTPLEWRLPKAPTPSKPDYSRAGPSVMTSYQFDSQIPRRHVATSRSYDVSSNTRRLDLTAEVMLNLPTLEIPVDDVAFVAESLNHLPNLPSFSFLRHSILAGQATYVQIVASILLHQRQLRAKDQRDSLWTFPGFCSGCKRAGFCYGCSKNLKPHVHEDIPAMTGGGFRFWKRDRPRDPQSWKNPVNWKVPSTDEELRAVIEKYGDLSAYERARLRASKRAKYDVIQEETSQDHGARYQRLKNLGTYPPYVTIVSTDDFVHQAQLEEVVADVVTIDRELAEGEELQRRRGAREEMRRKRKFGVARYEEVTQEREVTLASEGPSDRMLVRFDTRYDDELPEGGTRVGQGSEDEEDEGIVTERSRGRHKSRVSIIKSSRDRSESSHGQGHWSPVRTQKTSRLGFVDKLKEEEDEELARILRERAKENVPFGKKRRDVNYTAPKFFTVQKNSRKITVAKDPFSSDRDLDLPKGPTFQLKKSEKKATKFIEFKKGDRGWKAPKMFEVKHEQKKAIKFWSPSPSRSDSKGRRGRGGDDVDDEELRRCRRKDVSSDSGISSGIAGDKDTNNGNTTDQDRNDVTLNADDKLGADNDDVNQADGGQEVGDSVIAVAAVKEVQAKPKRREVVKKSRVEKSLVITPPQSPPHLPSPPPYKKRSPTPPSPPPPQSPAPEVEEPPLPEIDIPEVPDLPEITEKVPVEKKKQKLKFIVEPPPQPQLKETPKQRKTAPKIRLVPRNLSRPRKSRPAEAPVTAEDLNDIQDPLDFLAKYCIINPDRLPFYEVVFEATIVEQAPRYNKPAPWVQPEKPQTSESEDVVEVSGEKKSLDEKVETNKKGKSKKMKSAAVKRELPALNTALLPTEHGMNLEKVAMTLEEQHLEKLIYTLDMLQDKMNILGGQLEELEAKRTEIIAQKARQRFPEIALPNYLPKKKKKGKKGNKKNHASEETPHKFHPEEITDDIVVSRLEDKLLNEICQEPDLKMLESEIEIRKLKAKDIQNRVEQIASEKLLADAFCMNHYFLRQGVSNNFPEHYRRQQSELYNRLRPNPDFEMNLEEVEEALQQINNHLLTEKEFFFLYNVLNLPGRERINFRLFTIIAALSEKVTQLDPVIRKLINNFNYNALDIKMEKCKELFELLESEHMPKGAAQAASLAVELTAGGLRPEHTRYVLNKFNRDSKGVIDFLDFVTYVPLFVEIHKRIINNPLSEKLDL